MFQGPLWTYATTRIESSTLQLVSLQILQMCLFASLLLLIAGLSVWLMKALASVLLITNAVALYFMHSYQIETDLTMITNILATNTGQASELWH